MNRSLAPILFLAGLLLCACKKDEPSKPATPGGGPPPPPPAQFDAELSLRLSVISGGSPTASAEAYFIGTDGNPVEMESVQMNFEPLIWWPGGMYTSPTPNDWDITSMTFWMVLGANGFPTLGEDAFEIDHPTVGSIENTTASLSQPWTLSVSELAGADEVAFFFGNHSRTVQGDQAAYTFTQAEMASSNPGPFPTALVLARKFLYKTIDGKVFRFVKSRSVLAQITVEP